MHFLKKNINGSPFLGVFIAASDTFAIAPKSISKKEEKELTETLGVKIVKANIANSSLSGVLIAMHKDKVVVSDMMEKDEKKYLENHGLEVKQITDAGALGNLIALNDNGGIASTMLARKTVAEISEFFGVEFVHTDIAGSNLVGACIEVTNNGFIVNPKVSEQDFKLLEKIFKVNGVPTTANYGDRFVGNDVVANSNGVAIGSITTTHEMTRIDEAFRRD